MFFHVASYNKIKWVLQIQFVLCLILIELSAFLCLAGEGGKRDIPFQVIGSYPHDARAFTQGLFFEGGIFYEGTGLYGSSSLRMVAAETGEIKKMSLLPGGWFGEGVTVLGDKVIQLTWRSKVGIVYDKKTFRRLKTFNYNHEGWGITYDGRHLIVSDGSNVLRFWDPRDFQEVSRRPVMEGETPVYGLNELEFIDGYIFANVWPTDRIVRIDPASGKVVGEIDVCPLLSLINKKKVDVTNGIAYDPKTKRVFVTGKYWPRVFVLFIKNSEAR